jgi:soluble lytic murein transglycosylase-like protein
LYGAVGHWRAIVLATALGVSAASLAALWSGPPAAPAPLLVASVAPLPRAAAPQPARASNQWAVVIDGWRIALDSVAARPLPGGDPPVFETPLLSPYDRVIAQYAESAGLDWRFIAAIIYEESRFAAYSVSDAGAYGLMQVRPIAAREVGEPEFLDPEANIRTGVRYLERLRTAYGAARDRDLQALMLAAYNMGPAHVQDAQALARRFGYDPLRWDGSMDVMVSLLEEPSVSGRLPNGFARGRSVVDYVNRVLERFASYRRALPARPPVNAVAVATKQ